MPSGQHRQKNSHTLPQTAFFGDFAHWVVIKRRCYVYSEATIFQRLV